jgi:hypothetical protein
MMALLVRREILIPRMAGGSFQAAAVPSAPQDSWMGIYLPDGQKIGFMHSTAMPELRDGEEGARFGMSVTMRTKILGEVTPVKIAGNAWASASNGLRDFEFTVRSGDIEAGINAEIRDGILDATFDLEGEQFPIQWPIDQDLFLWSGMGASNMYFPSMEEGDEFFIDAFDPVTLSKSPVLVRCVSTEEFRLNDEIYTARVIDMEYDTYTARAHIDAATGEVLRAETPLGITLQRIDPGDISDDLSEDEAADFFGLAAVETKGLTPRRGIQRMAIRITGLDEWAGIPTGDTQRAISDNTIEIVVPDPPSALNANSNQESTEPVRKPEIPTKLADRLTEAETRWEQIQIVSRYVTREQRPNAGIRSLDIQTIATIGANELASRFATIAGAAGFDVRIVAGLVWVNAEIGFQYHTWPEVYLDRWYWCDPALDQWPADAAHIQLSESADDWPRLVRMLPLIDIEVIEVE